MGRPTKYKPEYCEELIEYFNKEPYRERKVTHKNKKGDEWITYEDVANDLPFLSQFAHSIGVTTSSLERWRKEYPEFSEAYKKAKEMQHNMLATNALRGLYQVAFSIFTAKNITSWRDKQEVSYSMPDKKSEEFESLSNDELIRRTKELAQDILKS